MKTKLEIGDDAWSAALEIAQRDNKPVDAVISELLRTALAARNPFRPFASRGGRVTNEIVNRLRHGDA
jgi:hypothetical protein